VEAASSEGARLYVAFPLELSERVAVVPSNLTMPGVERSEATTPPAVLYVEYPRVDDGVATLNGRQTFQLMGWATSPQGIERLDVYVDGHYAGTAAYGSLREDVAAVFPLWGNSRRSGFNLRLSEKTFLRSPATVEIVAQLASGKMVNGQFALHFEAAPAAMIPSASPFAHLMADIGIWQFARTIKMFAPGQEEQRLRAFEEQCEARGDSEGKAKAQDIKMAIKLLGDAWSGKQLDRGLDQYLRENGYGRSG